MTEGIAVTGRPVRGHYSETQAEADIRAKGLNAPRVTGELIDDRIVGEAFHRFPGTTLIVCCLMLANGFCVTGHSAAASPANFDEQIGRDLARSAARDKVWMLEGYLLRERLHLHEIGAG